MKLSKNDYMYILIWSKKIKMVNHLGGVCVNCGSNNIFVLEFHHPNGDKEFSINFIRECRWSVIERECSKCVLLCRNCHAELHYEDGGIDRRRSLLKQKMLEYKGIFCCEKCGYKGKNYRSLEFHHRKENEKSFEIFSEVWKVKKIKKVGVEEKILRELDKCDVICRNCHGVKHTSIDKFDIFKDKILERVSLYKEVPSIDKNLVLKMHGEGVKNIDIAKKLGCAKSSITYLLQKYG